MEQSVTIGEIISAIRRRWLLAVLIGGLGALASVFYAFTRPSLYETSARILVERQQIPDELARSTVNLSAAQRIQLIEERLLARDNLRAVIDQLGLFTENSGLPVAKQIDLIRESTRIESISGVNTGQGWGGDAGIFAFTITVQLGDPQAAANAANGFADAAIEQNALVRAERAADTLRYFEREAERVATQIETLEAEIATFKQANEGALPETLQFRRDELERVQANALEAERRILELESDQSAIEVTIAASSRSEPLSRSPEETELRQLEIELAQRRRLLGTRHPEIQQLESRIAAVSELVRTDASSSPVTAAEPTETEGDALGRRLTQIAAQIDLLQGQRDAMSMRWAELESLIGATPEVEVTLAAYARRLAELQDQQSVATQRLSEARTGEQLEVNQQAERFTVVEQALVPTDPIGPNRRKIVVFGSAASLGLALGLAFVLEVLNPVLRSSVQMERQLGIRPVISIPHISTSWERRRRRLSWIAAPLLVVGGLLAAMWSFESPGVMLDMIVDGATLADLRSIIGDGS